MLQQVNLKKGRRYIVDNSNIKIHIGSKFFRYIDKDNEQVLELIRILKADPIKDKIRYFDMHTGKANTIDYKTLIDNYSELSPDGSIIFAVASVGNANDVIVALKDYANKSKNELPYAVCRQSIHDFFQDFNKEDFRRISVGISVSQDTCPSNIHFGQVLTCDASKEIYQKHVMIYLDDTLDDILKLVRSTKYDNALKKLKTMAYQEARQEGFNENNIIGYCESLRDLLESNTFMYDFRKCFNIVEVPFHIDPDRDTVCQVADRIFSFFSTPHCGKYSPVTSSETPRSVPVHPAALAVPGRDVSAGCGASPETPAVLPDSCAPLPPKRHPFPCSPLPETAAAPHPAAVHSPCGAAKRPGFAAAVPVVCSAVRRLSPSGTAW